jgi:hypothetical protein
MNGYMISVPDRAGAVAAVFEAAAARGVNIFPAYGLADGSTGLILVGSDDEAGLRAAIADAGLSATALEMVVADLENRPGTGAALLRRISDAGVSLRAAVPVGMSGDRVQLALAADDTAALKAAVGG